MADDKVSGGTGETIPIPFRHAEDVSVSTSPDGAERRYFLRTPSGRVFAFGEQEHFLWKSLDGRASFADIGRAFAARFGLAISQRDLLEFVAQGVRSAIIVECVGDPDYDRGKDFDLTAVAEPAARPAERAAWPTLPREPLSIILGTPERLFKFLARLFWPLCYVKWIWAPCTLYACLIVIKNWNLYQSDFLVIYKNIPYEPCLYALEHTLAALTRVMEGSIVTAFGGTVRYLGLRCFMGVLVRVIIDERGAREMPLRARCWAKGGALIFRVMVFNLSIFLWIAARGTHPLTSKAALFSAVLAFITFWINACPLIRGDGYELLATALGLHDLQRRSYRLMGIRLGGRGAPAALTAHERIGLAFFAVGSAIASLFIVGHILLNIDSYIYGAIQGLGLLVVLFISLVAGIYFYYLKIYFGQVEAFKKAVYKRVQEEKAARA